jgi:hypothetical protein
VSAPHPCLFPIWVNGQAHRTCPCHWMQKCSEPLVFAKTADRPQLVLVGQ